MSFETHPFRDVFAWSPAMALLVELEEAGLAVSVTEDGQRVRVTPAGRLTENQRQRLVEHRSAVRLAALCLDPGVQARCDLFQRQLAEADPSVIVPALRFRPDCETVVGACLSCAEAIGHFGLCWRCRLAVKGVLGLPIPHDFDGHDRLRQSSAA